MKKIPLLIAIVAMATLLASTAGATTYYVADPNNPNPNAAWGGVPSDGNSGTSWSSAWASISKVNSSVSGGDTVFFSTGIWRTATDEILEPIEGTFSDRTTYACSSFAATNAAGEYHFAQIWGSIDYSGGMSPYSGNIYYRTGWNGPAYHAILYQNDTVLQRQGSYGALSEGEWYTRADTLFVYCHNLGSGYNPANYYIELGAQTWITMDRHGSSNGQDYITFYGLRFKYASTHGVVTTISSQEVDPYDHVYFDHCHLSHNGDWHGWNPALIYSGFGGGSHLGEYNRIRACSLGYSYALGGTQTVETFPQDFGYSNKGSGVCHYSQRYYTIDSCTFYGFFQESAIYWKAAHSPSSPGFNNHNVFAYNLFTNEHGRAIEYFGVLDSAEIYGNVAIGVECFYLERWDDSPDNPGHNMIYNNTIVNCPDIVRWRNDEGATKIYGNQFRRNVCFNSGSQLFSIVDIGGSTSNWVEINNNIYYTGGNLNFDVNGSARSWSQWQAAGADVSSLSLSSSQEDFTGSPTNFGNITSYAMAADSLARNVSSEMDSTYGGQRFTKYGAIQTNPGPPPPDTIAPIISNVNAGGMNASTATISWTTNETASSQVEYGLTTGYGSFTPLDPTLSTGHSVGLSGLDSATTYHYRVRSTDGAGNEAISGDFTFTTLNQTQSNVALGAAVTVSGSYSGYTGAVLTDGVYDPRGGSAGTWASDESSSLAHWIEIDFGSTQSVDMVTMNWAYNSGQSTWMTSQQYAIQAWNGIGWTDITYVTTSSVDSTTSTAFTATNTSRIRIYQPANMGPVGYSVIMWATEVEVLSGGASGDVTPPAAINDLGWLPDENIEGMILGTIDSSELQQLWYFIPHRRYDPGWVG